MYTFSVHYVYLGTYLSSNQASKNKTKQENKNKIIIVFFGLGLIANQFPQHYSEKEITQCKYTKLFMFLEIAVVVLLLYSSYYYVMWLPVNHQTNYVLNWMWNNCI